MKNTRFFRSLCALFLLITSTFFVACADKEALEDLLNPPGEDEGGGGGGTGGNGTGSGEAVYFDGTGKSITLSSAWYTGDFTICLWMKPQSVLGHTLFSMSAGDKYFYLSFDNDEIDWKFESADDADMTIDASATFVVGNTYQVCAVGDHGGNLSRVYVNGAQVGGTGGSLGATVAPALTTLTIGAEPAPTFQSADGNKVRPFHGTMDNFMIWRYALPANAINQLYAGGVGFDPRFAFSNYTVTHLAALQVYYLMGNNGGDVISGGGATLIDSQGNQNASPVGFAAGDTDDDLW